MTAKSNADIAPIAALDGWGMAKPNKTLPLPSGASVVVRKLSIPDLIELNILDKLDGFSGKVLDGGKGKGKKKAQADTISSLDPEQLLSLMEVLDKITVAAVVSPKIEAQPEDEDDEEEGVRYAHHIDLPDKMAIFEASFEGMSEFFRLGGEQAAGVGDVATIEGSAQVTE